MRIDAHLHFWRPSHGFDNRPVADNAAYRRDFLPDDVRPAMLVSGIDAAVLVQTCPQVEETAWLVEMARDVEWIAAITGWVDLDGSAVDYEAFLAQPKVTGIRAQLRRVADDAFVLRPRVVANINRAFQAGADVTLLIERRHYRHVSTLLDALAPGPLTINHLGLAFPDVPRDEWRATMKRLAARPQTFLQFSGIPFMYGERWRDDASAIALMDDALAIFGPRRLLFASDWPMMIRFATYEDWVRAVEEFVSRHMLSQADVAAIFGGNAFDAHPRIAVAHALS